MNNNIHQISRVLNPLIKGLPFIIIVVIAMAFIANRIVMYSTPLYECTGRIKLEDPTTDISNTNLFKTFDVFNTPSKIMAEVEVLKSSETIKSALKTLGFDISYYRVGKIRTSELFFDSPFQVGFQITEPAYYGVQINIIIVDTSNFVLDFVLGSKRIIRKGKFGGIIKLDGLDLAITLNNLILKKKPGINIHDHYYFTIYSKENQIEMLAKLIDIKELDKEIPVIRIICKHSVPEKAMMLTNILMDTYIEEGIRIKNRAAKRTVDFIDKQLKEVAHKLENSEGNIESFRLKKKVTNTKMEIDTDLKKISQLKIQLTNVEMNLASLDTLDNYINNADGDFLSKAPNYEGYGGLLYTELMKRLKELQSEKKDMMLLYTPENPKVVVMDAKIEDVVSYIKQNINNAKKSMRIQRNKIFNDILIAEQPFLDIPSKEKNMVILEREFQLNQNIYNFLSEKRTEASIAGAATFSFHRIIERATLPNKPVSPKKTFTIIVFCFLGLLFSLAAIYTYDALSAKIKYTDQLEKNSSCPVIAEIGNESDTKKSLNDFFVLATKIRFSNTGSQLITIASGIDSDGKTFVAERLAKAFSEMKVTVLLVYSDLRDETLQYSKGNNGSFGFCEYVTQKMPVEKCIYKDANSNLYIMPTGKKEHIPEAVLSNTDLQESLMALKKMFSIVIFDTPSFDKALDAIYLMKCSDMSLYIFRANHTKTKITIVPDLLVKEHSLKNVQLVLNDVEDFSKMKKVKAILNIITKIRKRLTALFK